MWSDSDIDNAFQRLNPLEPGPTPFPLDAWLRLETQLDKAVIARAVRRKMWKIFGAEIVVVALIALTWLLWPTRHAASTTKATPAAASITNGPPAASAVTARPAQAAAAPALATPAAAAAAASLGAEAPDAQEAQAATASAAGPAAGRPVAADIVKAPQVLAQTKHLPVAPPFAASSLVNPREPKRPVRKSAEGSENPLASSELSVEVAAVLRQPKREPEGRPGITRQKQKAFDAQLLAGAAALDRTRARTAPSPVADDASTSHHQSPGTARQYQALPTSPNKDAAPRGTATTPPDAAPVATAASAAPDGAAPNSTALALQPVALATTEAPALPAPLATMELATEPRQKEAPAAKHPRFYVGLMGAPDVTTVKFAGVERPMLNLGITLEYRLTDRLRVNTGLLRSTKQYVARRDDYDWGRYRYLVYQHDFEDVGGACTVLDVPLSLRYDFLNRPQYRLFGSAGLSSFFMQREKYYYAWQEQGKEFLWQREVVNENRHLLSIFNLSFGYERALSSRWSVQAEPYLKVPLGGVGLGKVLLTSAGVFVGVKYGF